MQKLIRELGCQFKFELIANEKFLNRVFYPTLLASDKVSDTSELFLRSYRMLQMFSGIKFSMQDLNLDDYKIGELANTMSKGIIENTNISNEEIKNLLDKKYSKEMFNIDYPVLVKTGEKHDKYDKNRYYKDPIIFGNKQYLLCNNWIERTNKEYLLNWIKNKYK